MPSISNNLIDYDCFCRFYSCGKVQLPIHFFEDENGRQHSQDTSINADTTTKEFNFMVMQMLSSNLSDIRKRQPGARFSIATTALLAKQMLYAIQKLHDQGYLHRDIKPVRHWRCRSSNSIVQLCYGFRNIRYTRTIKRAATVLSHRFRSCKTLQIRRWDISRSNDQTENVPMLFKTCFPIVMRLMQLYWIFISLSH
jgi:hypothetical protein